ncbi:MAG: TlyA family RNA methyltransferase [Anaerolineales bacterium]|nr:TlyA family RNA methyltransferase [Anaerolineales bacterium]HUS83510.1 TlyA family RNA methyltransferase [Anaerolineales bacterium]
MSKKKRIDLLLVDRGLAESRSQAQKLIMAGLVRVQGQLIHKASQTVEQGMLIELTSGPRFVSRGGEKLQAAVETFPVTLEDRICADVGASTGGFTDCLLQNGAARVYTIDVGKGLLHWKLRNDARVVLIEETNARYLETLPECVHLVTMDASFISLRKLLPVIAGWLKPGGDVIALIKPQFEAGPARVGRGGVVRDPEVHRDVVHRVLDFAVEHSLAPQGLIQSPLRGPKGNVEFLTWLRKDAQARNTDDLLESLFAS